MCDAFRKASLNMYPHLNFEKLPGVISMLESLEEKFVDETMPDLDRLLRFVLVVSQH